MPHVEKEQRITPIYIGIRENKIVHLKAAFTILPIPLGQIRSMLVCQMKGILGILACALLPGDCLVYHEVAKLYTA